MYVSLWRPGKGYNKTIGGNWTRNSEADCRYHRNRVALVRYRVSGCRDYSGDLGRAYYDGRAVSFRGPSFSETVGVAN